MQTQIANFSHCGHISGDSLPARETKISGDRVLDGNHKQHISLQVLKKFRVICGSVRQHFREIEQRCGVSGSQLWIMQEIRNTPGIGVTELANRLSIHQSTCSQLVEKLVIHGLISKDRKREDQRRVGLYLTKAAELRIHLAPGPAEGLLPEALRELPAETILTLDTALQEVIQQLQIKDHKLAEKPLADL